MLVYVRSIALALLFACLTLAACSRDREDVLRATLADWFYIEETTFFESQMRCTTAVFKVSKTEPRPALIVHRDLAVAKSAFRAHGRAALAMVGFSPNDMIDALLLSGRGTMGKEALAAGAQAGSCLKGSGAEAALRSALTQDGAIIAYDQALDGLMVLDANQGRLFFVAGDTV